MLPDVPQHLIMHGISWSYYEQTLNEIGNGSIRVAYLDGVMEFMSLTAEQERLGMAIAGLIVTLVVEHRIPLKSYGATTFRRQDKSAGNEPSESFYFNEIASVTGMERFDPLIHRAPDLWVEVDILNPSVPREPIYARLGVPEVWRYSKDRLTVRLLTPAGIYNDSPTSMAFPFLPMAAFAGFIPKMIHGDETHILLEFREWVRSLPR